ncbi:MAG: O-antigen ligase family protein [Syntrophotaleaceae bacterium]
MIFYYWKVSYHFPIFISIKAQLIYGCILLIIIILKLTSLDQDIKTHPIFRTFLYFLIAYSLSFLFAWDYLFSWENSVYHFLIVLIIAMGVLVSVKDEADIKIVIFSIVFMYLYLAYEPMYRFLFKTSGNVHLYGDVFVADLGILSGHVSLANNMNQMIPIAIFLPFLIDNKIFKIVSIIPLLVFLITLIGSNSRGGVVGLLFLFLCLIFFSSKITSSKWIFVVIGGVFLVFGGLLMDTFSRINPDSAEGRLIRLVHGIEMVRKGNFFGVGPGCYILASGKYFGHRMMSHNMYGQLVGDLGVPGAITWFIFMYNVLRSLNESRKNIKYDLNDSKYCYHYLALGLMLSLLVRMLIGLGAHSLYFFNWYVFGMLALHISRQNMAEKQIIMKR